MPQPKNPIPADPAAILDRAVARYVAERQERVDSFCQRHFSIRGSLRLHRRALGLDLLRAPVNLLLVVPTVVLLASGALLSAAGARRAGAWLGQRNLFFETAVSREITWLIYTELLELPFTQGDRTSSRDALAEAVNNDPAVSAAVARLEWLRHEAGRQPGVGTDVARALRAYTGVRNAVADLGNTALMLSAGAVSLSKVTPGALSLGPAVAALIAQQAAIGSFPLGVGLGTLWYGLFPTAPSLGLMVGATGLLMTIAAVVAALSGVVLDPIQLRLGVHQRRLRRFIDRLAGRLSGSGDGAYPVREHYLARLVDLFELTSMVLR